MCLTKKLLLPFCERDFLCLIVMLLMFGNGDDEKGNDEDGGDDDDDNMDRQKSNMCPVSRCPEGVIDRLPMGRCGPAPPQYLQ